jgi:integrase
MIKAHIRRREKDETQRVSDSVARYWVNAEIDHIGLDLLIDKIVMERFYQEVLPWLVRRAISKTVARDLMNRLERIDVSDTLEVAHSVLWYCENIFRSAIAGRDVFTDPQGKLSSVKTGGVAIEYPAAVEDILRAIDLYRGTFALECVLRLALLMLVSPGELRETKWSEINLETAQWSIPGERTKTRNRYIVPLSPLDVGILLELHPLTGDGLYVFPSIPTSARPARAMSATALNEGLRRAGYSSEEVAIEDFRSLASKRLGELGFKADKDDPDERRAMMERWEECVFELPRSLQSRRLCLV